MSIFIATLLTIPKRWKQPKGLWTNEYLNKIRCVHVIGYYAALKKEDNSVSHYKMKMSCLVK